MNSTTKEHPANLIANPALVRKHAGNGYNIKQIAAQFNLLEEEFEVVLKADKQLNRQYLLGIADLECKMQKKLMENGDTGITLLNARRFLKLEDPVMEALSGDLLKITLSKLDTKTKHTLAKALNIKKK